MPYHVSMEKLAIGRMRRDVRQYQSRVVIGGGVIVGVESVGVKIKLCRKGLLNSRCARIADVREESERIGPLAPAIRLTHVLKRSRHDFIGH